MIDVCLVPALVLLDEVGTGTDPEEGSALGVAVVDYFKQRSAHVLATTHYSGLKMYAATEPGVLNASVEFDEKTLQPTYRLLVGIAGSSSGLEIAQRFGSPRELIGRANEQVKKSSRDAIEYLRRIKHEADEAQALRRALEEERAAVAEKFNALDGHFRKREHERQSQFETELAGVVAQFETRSKELVAKVRDRAERAKVEREAQKRVAELKREAQRATDASKQIGRSKAVARLQQPHGQEGGSPPHLRGVRVVRDGRVIADVIKPTAEIGSMVSEQAASGDEAGIRSAFGDRTPHVGDRVRLRTFGSIGIVDGIKGDEADVRVGSLHMREKLENLDLVDKDEVRTVRGSGRLKSSLEDLRRQSATTELHLHSNSTQPLTNAVSELNLIGKTTDQAVELTDKFLDEAFLNGQNEVRIIHGHGTGALRKAVAELLADHPHVARFAAAPQDQGGSGATVVTLKL